jgi:hypothetical protein
VFAAAAPASPLLLLLLSLLLQEVLLRLLESEGRGEDAVKVEAQKLLNAFHINVLL